MSLPSIVFDIGSVLPSPVQNGIFGVGGNVQAWAPSQLIGPPPLPVGLRLWLPSVVGGGAIDCLGVTAVWRGLKAVRHGLVESGC